MKKYMVVGGAGFIGHHLVKSLLMDGNQVVVYDNLSSGKLSFLGDVAHIYLLKIVIGDVEDTPKLVDAMWGIDVVIHLASNPDIAKAMTKPIIDFWEGTYLTQCVLEAMRLCGVKKIIYASGSGVYGERGFHKVSESASNMNPISTYGASKIAGEALISAYCHLFDMSGIALRFANVVGKNQTHGVVLDFINKLLKNSEELLILGDGSQSKSYIHISDIVNAITIANKIVERKSSGFIALNVATEDYITVNKIANIVVKKMDIGNVKYLYSGGDRGFKGDVPIVRFNTNYIRNFGWKNEYTSEEAILKAVEENLEAINGKSI